MKRMNRKGLEIADPMFVLITIISLTLLYMNVGASLPETKIGEKQTNIFSTVQSTQNEMFFLDLGAKYAGIDTIYDLASKGGFYEQNLCGNYYGESLWNYKNKEDEYANCLPEVERELEKEFEENYNKFLEKNEKNTDYKYFVQEDKGLEIRGISLTHQEKEIEPERKYVYKTTTTQKYDYNLSAYNKINEFIEVLNEHCKEKENIQYGSELTFCVAEAITEFEDELNPFLELKAIYPSNKNSNLNFQQYLKEIMRTGYEECYFKFPKIKNAQYQYEIENTVDEKESQATIKIIHENEEIGKIDSETLFYLIKPNREKKLNIYPGKTIKYDLETQELTYDFEGSKKTEQAEMDLFKIDKNKAGFIPKQEISDYTTYLQNRPCSYENRMYIFELKEKELYPEKGNITYTFASYIKDKKEPYVPEVRIESKEFDEGTLLIRWKHTDSLDLMNYTIFLEGVPIKTIVPWKNVNIHEKINWKYGDKKPFNTCKLENEGSFKKCVYSFGDTFKDDQTYFFQESQEWVYVLNGLEDKKKYDIVIKATDDDGNTFSTERKPGISKDTLPFAPVEFQVTNDPLRTDPRTQIYKGIIGSPIITQFNMDGTLGTGFEFEFIHSSAPIITFNENQLNNYYTIGAPVPGYSLILPTYYLVIQKDPSLKEMPLFVEEMGYKVKTIPGE